MIFHVKRCFLISETQDPRLHLYIYIQMEVRVLSSFLRCHWTALNQFEPVLTIFWTSFRSHLYQSRLVQTPKFILKTYLCLWTSVDCFFTSSNQFLDWFQEQKTKHRMHTLFKLKSVYTVSNWSKKEPNWSTLVQTDLTGLNWSINQSKQVLKPVHELVQILVTDLQPFQIWVPAIPPLYICGGFAGTQILNVSTSVTIGPSRLFTESNLLKNEF